MSYHKIHKKKAKYEENTYSESFLDRLPKIKKPFELCRYISGTKFFSDKQYSRVHYLDIKASMAYACSAAISTKYVHF